MKNFERELPDGYRVSLHINAKAAKFGIIFNAIALVILAVVMVLACLPLSGRWGEVFDVDPITMLIAYAVFIVADIAYIVLHELVHGAAYKLLTGEKLTFGMSWSCAYCGVPNIFVYRKAALIAVAAPLVLFTLIFLPLTVWLYFTSPIYYLIFAMTFGLHLGGCSGDCYVILLLLFKFKDERMLLRDTGPEQFFFLPVEGGDEDAA